MSAIYQPQRQAPIPDNNSGGPDRDITDDSEAASRLLRMLKAEENDALGYRQTDLQQQQIDALKHYFGEKYGDEEEGRSQVVTREVMETIQWTLPDLMRVFASGGNLIQLEETNESDSKYVKDAANYLAWILLVDNRGFRLMHDSAFDGLLHRNGWWACYWKDKEYRAPQRLTGISLEQLVQLNADPSIEIIDLEENPQSEAEGMTLTVRRTKSPARAEVVCIAPEDIRINGRAVEIDKARYVGRVIRMLRGEIAREWPDKRDEIMAYSGSAVSGPQNIRRGSDVRMERFRDQSDDWQATGNNAAQEIEVLQEYLRCDLDDDGYPEMIRSHRMGDLLLDAEEVEENPFGTWSYMPVPHRLIGLSQHDITQDLQRRSTVLTRAGLDAVYASVVSREAYDQNKVKDVAALTATYTGAKIPVDGDPAGAILPLSGGVDTATVAWEACAQLAVTLENRTGATRQTQGMDPDALLKGPHSGKAIDLLQTAGGARKELTARHLGDGFEVFLSKLYRLVCRNQNEPRQVKIGGKWCKFDPRTWNSDLRCRVHTGLGTGNRDQTLVGLQVIGERQADIISVAGPDNPMVTSENIHHTNEEICRALGYHSADGFFTEPPEVPVTDEQGQPVVDPQTGQPQTKPWAPQPQPDPAMAKAQADAQLQQQQQQIDAQNAQQEQDLKAKQAAGDMMLQQQKDGAALQAQQQKNAMEIQLAQQKAAAELQLARDKAALEAQLAQQAADREFQLGVMRLEMEERLERLKIEHQRAMHTEKLDATVQMNSDKLDTQEAIHKDRPGGSLAE